MFIIWRTNLHWNLGKPVTESSLIALVNAFVKWLFGYADIIFGIISSSINFLKLAIFIVESKVIDFCFEVVSKWSGVPSIYLKSAGSVILSFWDFIQSTIVWSYKVSLIVLNTLSFTVKFSTVSFNLLITLLSNL